MALKKSTGLRDFLACGGSLKEALDDTVLDIYSGSEPADDANNIAADKAVTGNKLVRLTLSGGNVANNAASVKQLDTVIVVAGDAANDNFTISIGSNNYTYTQPANNTTAATICEGLAALVDADRVVRAMPGSGNNLTNKCVLVQARFAGEGFNSSVAKNSANGTITLNANTISNNRANTVHFGLSSDGVISLKANESLAGNGLADGSASHFRLVKPNDTGNFSTTAIRLQGTCSLSGGDLNGTSLSVTANGPNVLEEFDLTVKAVTL